MMFCPDCGGDLNQVGTDQPCPECGRDRRSATVFPQPASAVARAHNPGTVSTSHYPDGTEEVVVGSGDGRIAKSSVRDGVQRQSYNWVSTGSENERAAIHRFRDALNRSAGGQPWCGECAIELTATRTEVDGWLLPSTMPAGYSCEDGPPSGALLCQVVRVEQKTRLARSHGGEVLASEQHAHLVGAVLETIDRKEVIAARDVVLLLDANDAPAFVRSPDVAEGAQGELAARKGSTGWSEIWLVGLNCYRVWPLEREPGRSAP